MGGGGGKSTPQPVYEPVKSAEQSMKEASAETSRAQQLRRGITSTFSRASMGNVNATSATSGSAAKLGE